MQKMDTQLLVGTYALDTAQSTVAFTTKHMFGTGRVNGTFAPMSATVLASGSSVVIDAFIDAGSFSTGNTKRDTKVLSATFLDVVNHPTISFRADRATLGGEEETVNGTLTVRGVARPVALAVSAVRSDGEGIIVIASTTIDRYSFGVTAMKGMASRRLTFDLSLRFTRV